MYRDEEDHAPVDYYQRLPPGLGDAHVIVPDPMLATGGSAVHALRRLKEAGAQRLRLVCLVCAPEGVAAVEEAHPDVEIWTAALDRELDDNAFIRPGLGDAGDRAVRDRRVASGSRPPARLHKRVAPPPAEPAPANARREADGPVAPGANA